MKGTGFHLGVNGAERRVTCELGTPLLDVLRDGRGEVRLRDGVVRGVLRADRGPRPMVL
jgi:aerobic-type carbon monoxide dehydrogenase small subunit (CoxS/CutS family)